MTEYRLYDSTSGFIRNTFDMCWTSYGSPGNKFKSWLFNLGDDIDTKFTDIPILACCFVSGLCDSIAFSAASVFVSMQTGNTLFVALGASYLPTNSPHLWLRALVSLACFWLGCFVFSNSRHIHPQRKATLFASFLIQSICIFIAAALAQSKVAPAFSMASLGPGTKIKSSDESDEKNLLPLAFLAFQFGGQIVTSRILKFNEIPTNVLTSVYCDLLSDPFALAPLKDNPKRNRRVLAIVLLITGGISGGWLQRSRGGMSSALWLAGFIKFIIAAGWSLWIGKPPLSTDESEIKT